jgi:alkylation response protein AidB-like acyl-CoA dehydrogenase
MAQQLVDKRDLDFVLWEQLDCEGLIGKGVYADFNRKSCDMVVTEARRLALKEMLPTLSEGDQVGVAWDNGAVTVPECFQRPYELLLEGSWGCLGVPDAMGGAGAPPFVAAAAAEYFMGAGWALYSYAAMGCGTADMIEKYGTAGQREMYVKKLVSGEWGGTMLLTEPEAGSDVGALTTSAVKNGDGTYTLTGNKIFITNGEQNLTDNIIHPVLARIEGDPAGTKGISIFIVPKYMVNADGSLGERNDIVCTGVEEKHGIHASATCSMSLGSKGRCIGYLLGEERQGMKIMFNMMNGARMGTGLQALAYASAAYLEALNYARERKQGRDLAAFKDLDAPSVPIIHHPDVRRNLLWMKACVDGMRSFFYYTAQCGALAETAEDDAVREENNDLFELFTPLIKCYLSDVGYDVCTQAVQVFGGAGYTADYPVEQFMRDCKITSIFEGTSGIQAMDLLGRKLGMKKGRVFLAFMARLQSTIAEARKIEALQDAADRLERAVNRLGEGAMHLGTIAMSAEFKTAFAHALPFLHSMGDVINGWMLLWRAVAAAPKIKTAKKKDAAFYRGQLTTADFFMQTVLPITHGRLDTISGSCPAAVEMEDAAFGGL